jgi:hypothetical protein
MSIIYKKNILILSTLIILISLSPCITAWDDCPFGYEDEPYPGTCWRYIDENNDGICDHSQSESTGETQDESTEENSDSINKQDSTRFPVLLIVSFIIILILIIVLKSLVKRKKISNSKEKIIFNILLLVFFIPSAITGVLLLLITNMRILIELGQNLTQLHNISSLFFMWISGYHIIWHTKYYLKSVKNLLK